MIQFEHVSKSYGKTQILKDLTFTIPDGQFVVLIGPSGCGKTTTLKTINRLIEPDSGTISIDGRDVRETDKVQLRRHIGYVIQQIGLFPNMTVAQNICVVPKLLRYDKAKCDALVPDLLKMVGMEQHAGKYPSELSGGQQQRIGVLGPRRGASCRWPPRRRCWKSPPATWCAASWASTRRRTLRRRRWSPSCGPTSSV